MCISDLRKKLQERTHGTQRDSEKIHTPPYDVPAAERGEAKSLTDAPLRFLFLCTFMFRWNLSPGISWRPLLIVSVIEGGCKECYQNSNLRFPTA
ncbi:hypothetical protein NECAME_16728 [Necator americanus]|uniref:Uncharacterized protein n=1 Tax=Necator americanus TaxID=51031 RepID=W2TUT3_NECAM|nr:hypothetical protein NECAME_16728 [Necator americanus]ETN85593.1 hypothetical protein NECAME_16728 [Necator americanus]